MQEWSERELLTAAFEQFRELLGGDDIGLEIDQQRRNGSTGGVWKVRTDHLVAEMAVQAYTRFAPRQVDQLVGGLSRSMIDQPVLVVAPWLSPRSRELLADQKINYLDLTGNVRIRVSRLPIVLHTDGAATDPSPPDRPRRGVQGRSVNGLVRALVDHAPPYRMTDLARVAGLSVPYVSRTVEALSEERLLRRGANRMIVDVEWPRLLRERARHYSLIKTNRARGYIARTGLVALTRALGWPGGVTEPSASGPEPDKIWVTGSYAVDDSVKITAPTQLALYVPDIETFAEGHQLMPADRGVNVLLLRAAHPSQLERAQPVGSAYRVGVSQLALDCLGGNGRLPEEGEALIKWMQNHVDLWRRPHLPSD